jgi:hypothetical protein
MDVSEMETTICIDDKNILKKSYKLRPTGKSGSTIETSIPREVFERDARRLGLTTEEALEKLVAVWRFNSFHGLHLSFEVKDEKASKKSEKT